ncbi:MAG: hypothetical protein AVDCRST_MAG59-4971 [uncultured Thermomicrobiales bacterium]|uniref:Tryptophan synthase alpha chain n=1 Tax=uncultured Thermomicrobiales bacterium TaxID=1645740 RepID=A0A6J4VQY1_9BACT|nr:MAG: hypothetical protein AVDCRST_MAG59-4971 [uncultured Thermomicrobiales bacterium]
MDPRRFDALTRGLASTSDRRRAVRTAVAGLLSGAAAARGLTGAGATKKQTCRREACEPGAAGDGFCQKLGGKTCVCLPPEAGAETGKPPKGTCGTRGGPVTCLAEACTTDADCAQGVPNCTCQTNGKCGEVCEPLSCAEIGAECGVQPDGCDGTVDCGPCRRGECDNGICRGVCVPDTREEACAGLECGTAGDGCGGEYGCGKCPRGERCLGNRCEAPKPPDRCPGHGLAGTPCDGRCKCQGGRRCRNGRCCEPVGDGSVHCNSDADCCPGLTCARKAGGRHKTCLRKPIGRAAIPAADITAW